MLQPNFNKKLNILKSDILAKLQGPGWALTLPLFLLFGFIPLRLCLLFFNQYVPSTYMYMIGFFFLIISALWVKRFIPLCLNSKIVQALFYFGVSLENFMYTFKGFEAFYLTLSSLIIIILCPALILEFIAGIKWLYWFYCVFMASLVYLKLRQMFLFPPTNLVPELTQLDCMTLPQGEEDFSWKTIFANINKFSVGLYGLQVKNRLPSWNNRLLKEVGRRYMWKWSFKVDGSEIAKNAEAISQAPKGVKAAFGVFAVGSLLAGAFSLQTDRINAEANAENARANTENAQTNKLLAEIEKNRSEKDKFESARGFLHAFNDINKKNEVPLITDNKELGNAISEAKKVAWKSRIDAEKIVKEKLGSGSESLPKQGGEPKAMSLVDTDASFSVWLKKIAILIDFF